MSLDNHCHHEHCEHHEHHEHHDHNHNDHEGFLLFDAHMHEQAAVCSFELESCLNKESAHDALSQMLRELSEWVVRQDALIGHIKAYVKDYISQTIFSTTGSDIYQEEVEASGVLIGFAAIIIGVEAEQLAERIKELLADLSIMDMKSN